MSDLRMPRVNTVFISGNSVHRSESKTLPNGNTICKVRIACNRGPKDKQETDYFDVVSFGKSSEILHEACSAAHGIPLLIEGGLSYSEWDDKETGKKRSKVEIIANRVYTLAWAEKQTVHPDNRLPEDDESPL